MLNIFRHTFPYFAVVAILLGAMCSVPDALAQSSGAENTDTDAAEIRAMLENRDDAIKSILGGSESISDDQREQLRGLINDVIDFESMGAGALGRYWSKISTDEQADFVSVFAQIVRIQSLADVDVYRSSVVYDDISVDGDDAVVRTTTTYKSVPTPVDYSLHRTPGGWKATDIILDEVSTVKGYARSFQSVVRKKGFDDLMIRLNKRLETEKATSEEGM